MHGDAGSGEPRRLAVRSSTGEPLSRRELRRRRTELPQTAREAFSIASLFAPEADVDENEDRLPTILTVCTGNTWRSPLAEGLLRARLADLAVRVHSAGTLALVGTGMPAPAQVLAVAYGADEAAVAAHSARLLTGTILRTADLVLTMTADHASTVARMSPSLMPFAFPVREFARLTATLSEDQLRAAASAGETPRQRLTSAVLAVSNQRALAPRPNDIDNDVIDPYHRPVEVYEESARQLVPALAEVERVARIAVSDGGFAKRHP